MKSWRRRSIHWTLLVAGWTLGACAPPVGPPATPARPADAGPGEEASATAGWRHDWAEGAVFYEIFVRSFADSDGDGVGDLRGLAARLDYLNDGRPGGDDLGVDALWLMPVFASPSYHGYDTVDYERIEPAYGSDEDFATLLEEAHRRGLRVIVDLVLNHTSSEHRWFVGARASRADPRRSWYVWRGGDPGWTQPWGGTNRVWHAAGEESYYGVFWGGMPDLNWRNPAVREEMARVAELWLARGVDGFRLDATRHLVENGPGQLQVDQPETLAALRDLAARIRPRFPEALLVGENWTGPERVALYYGDDARLPGGDGLPASFDFALASALVAAARDGDASGVRAALAATAALYPRAALNAPFLTNHDMIRVTTELGDDLEAQGRAAALLLTLPGAPFLYYGEEIGMANGPGRRDEEKRAPMPWTGDGPGHGFTAAAEPWHPFTGDPAGRNVAAQLAAPGSLLAHYRRWIALRAGSPALRRGDLFLLPEAPAGTVAFLRRTEGERMLAVHHLGLSAASLPLPFPCAALSAAEVDGAVELGGAEGEGCTLALPARSSWVGRVATPRP